MDYIEYKFTLSSILCKQIYLFANSAVNRACLKCELHNLIRKFDSSS